jgi:hypothetical protein
MAREWEGERANVYGRGNTEGLYVKEINIETARR